MLRAGKNRSMNILIELFDTRYLKPSVVGVIKGNCGLPVSYSTANGRVYVVSLATLASPSYFVISKLHNLHGRLNLKDGRISSLPGALRAETLMTIAENAQLSFRSRHWA